MKNDKSNELGDALRNARGDRSIEALADELDVSRNTLGDYERGVRQPEVDFLVRFAAATGAALGTLLALRLAPTGAKDQAIVESLLQMARSRPELWTQVSAAMAGEPMPEYVADRQGQFLGEFALVKRRGLMGSAGAGAENVVLEPQGAIAFRRDWLLSKGVTNPDSLIVAEIGGDSMEPSLFDRDTVVFKQQSQVTVDDIYLFCLEGRMLVKRLSYKPGALEVISDNRDRYPPFTLTEREAGTQHFEVKGRFFWRGGDRLQ